MPARTWFNGQPANSVPADNRGLAYGDGLFETIAVIDSRPRLLSYHLDRLTLGCQRLGIAMPADPLAPARHVMAGDGVLKLIITRGATGRGYASHDQAGADCVLQWFPDPGSLAFTPAAPVAVITCRQRLARQPALAGLKHLNRLEQVLARAEWRDPAIADGLMFDTDGLLVDGVSSNVFIVSGGHLLTPRLDQCGVAGVLRRLVIERVAPAAGFTVQEAELPAAMLDQADELFLTSSLRGILPVAAIDGRALATQQVTQRLQRQLCEMETLGHV